MAFPRGIDYSWGRPDPAVIYASGFRFACRYFSHDTSGKNLTGAEAIRLRAHGVSIVSNWEYNKYDPLDGHAKGVSDAQTAIAQAIISGQPQGRPIYFSVDFDASTSQLATVAKYIDGAVSVLGKSRVGVYGGNRTVDYIVGKGHCPWGWQTYAWSGDTISKHAQLYQYSNGHTLDGVSVDWDRALTADFGAWDVETAETPPTTETEDDTATVGAWDYTPTIDGAAASIAALASITGNYSTLINNLRKL